MKTNLKKSNNQLSFNHKRLFVYMFLIWSIAVAQPIMNLFGNEPVFLIAHDIRSWLMILLVIVFNFIPPLLLSLFIITIGATSTKIKELITILIIAIFLFLFFMPFVSHLPNYQAFLVSMFFTILLLFSLLKFQPVRAFTYWYSLACLFFILLFLFNSPAKQLLPYFGHTISTESTIKRDPIFVFMLDEFPLISLLNEEYKIDSIKYPTFANLVNEATWYPNTISSSSSTEMAVPAILSGIQPTKKNVVGSYQNYPINLLTQFSATHETHAVEYATKLCPPYICKPLTDDKYRLLLEDTYVSYLHVIYPEDMKKKIPPINDRWVGFLRESKTMKNGLNKYSERLNTFNSFISSIKSYPANTVHYLHVLLPHTPWRVLPNLNLYGFYESDGTPGANVDNDKDITSMWEKNSWTTQLSWRRHLLQVGAVDSLIDKALSEIKSLGLYDQSTIVILSDHGSAFTPGLSRRFAHDENIPQIAAVPLFIKYPKQLIGNIDKRHASNMDVFPTILDVFDVKTESKLDGISLLSTEKRKAAGVIIQEGNNTTSLPSNYTTLFNETLENKKQLFVGDGWNGVYHPYGSERFVNKNIETLKIINTRESAVNFMNLNLFKYIDGKSKYTPLYYRLKIELDEFDFNEILVAIDGKLISHCFMFTVVKNECAGLFDPTTFYKKPNQQTPNIRLFAVLNKQQQYIVEELLMSNNFKAKLIVANNHEHIEINKNKLIPINQKGAPYGSVSLKIGNSGLLYRIGGWAGDPISGEAAKTIYVFINDELLTTNTGIKKPYLYNMYGHKSLINSGFLISFPTDQYPDLKSSKIRVFATSQNNKVNELNYHVNDFYPDLQAVFNYDNNRKIPKNALAILQKNLVEIEKNILFPNNTFNAFDVRFGSLIAGDWYKIKKHKRWLGSSAYIALPIDENSQSLVLNITAKPLSAKEGKQIMQIYINDSLVKELGFSQLTSHEASIDISMFNSQKPLIIRLEMLNSKTPKSIGMGNDSRYLSLLLTDFQIEIIKHRN